VGEFEGDVGVRVEREVVTYPQERVSDRQLKSSRNKTTHGMDDRFLVVVGFPWELVSGR
jgi:hypothetical protein